MRAGGKAAFERQRHPCGDDDLIEHGAGTECHEYGNRTIAAASFEQVAKIAQEAEPAALQDDAEGGSCQQ
ncbi:hypothetical protein D3C80_892850 [compost metagenome]